jgi:hypothetical protein
MAITVECPGGHKLRVKDEYAGRTGYCPRCKAKVKVPAAKSVTDDDILAIVNRSGSREPEPGVPSDSVLDHGAPAKGTSGLSLLGSSMIRGQKLCPACYHLASFSFSVCPTCGTPLPDKLSDDATSAHEPGRNDASPDG